MKNGFYIRENRLLIKGNRLLLVLTPNEVIDTVLKDADLFTKACKRGKSELRAIQNEKRMRKAEERIAQEIHESEAGLIRDIMLE